MRAELQPLQAAVAEARKLADFPEGRFHFVYTPDFLSTLVPELENVRQIAGVLELDVRLRIQKRHAEAAWQSARALLNTGRASGDEPLFIPQLVRINIQSLTVTSLERILAQGEVGEASLSGFQIALADEAAEPLFRFGLCRERAGMHQLFSNLQSGQISLSQVLSPGRKNPASPSLSEQVSEYFAGNMLLQSHAWLLVHLTEVIEITKLPVAEQYPALQKFDEWLRKEDEWLRKEDASNQAPVAGDVASFSRH